MPNNKLILCIFTLLLPSIMLAATAADSVGAFAGDLMDPVSVIYGFISTTSLAIGCCFLFAAFVKYTQYRMNPLAVPISTVITLVVLGAILVALPLVYKFSDIFK